MKKLNTAIFIFDGVEVLDFAGPFEVFSRTRLVAGVESRRSWFDAVALPLMLGAERMGSTEPWFSWAQVEDLLPRSLAEL